MKEKTPGRFAPSVKGTVRGWAALPRFRRKTETGGLEYFFGARFKRAPSVWMLWNGEEWSLIEEELFLGEFQASNETARKLLSKYKIPNPTESLLGSVADSLEGRAER